MTFVKAGKTKQKASRIILKDLFCCEQVLCSKSMEAHSKQCYCHLNLVLEALWEVASKSGVGFI